MEARAQKGLQRHEWSGMWEMYNSYRFHQESGSILDFKVSFIIMDTIFPQSPKLLRIVHCTLSTSNCLLLLYTYAAELVMLHNLQDKRDNLDATFFTFL